MAKYKKGESGNKSGRPVGSGISGEIRKTIVERAPELLEVVIIKAIDDGDSQAALALLNKVVPNLKSANEPVQFKLDTEEGLANTGQQIIQNIASGGISLDSGALLIKSLSDYGRLIELQDITERLARLEKLNEGKK